MGRGTIIITGGSGFCGGLLEKAFISAGYEVVIVSRSYPKNGIARHVKWNGVDLREWTNELNGARALINLAGRTVDCVKTPDHCDELLRSRVGTTRLLGEALREIADPPPVWVQMSTAHIYGDPPNTACTEDSPTGYGLAPFVGHSWEVAYRAAVLPKMREVIFRTSFVMARSGGALKRLAGLAKVGLGGTIGSGGQGMSWLHEEDFCRLFLKAVEDETMSGIYVASAPEPVSNKEFMKELRKAVRMPFSLPAPAWLVRAGTKLLRTDPELALYGRYCYSERLKQEGFEFKYPKIENAMGQLFS